MLKNLFNLFLFLIPLNIFSITISDYREEGNKHYYNQNYLRAIESYKEALLLNPNDLTSNYGLSNSFYMIGEYQEALNYIEQSIVLDSDNVELLNNKARILMAMGFYKESKELYNSVLNAEPYNINSKSGLAELRVVTGDIEGSLKEFEDISDFSPVSRRLMLSLVVLYDKTRYFEKSDAIIQKAIKNFPKDPVVLKAAVDHYIITENYTGASLYIDELLKASEDPNNILLQGKLYFLKKDYDRAIDSFSSFLRIDKNNHNAYYLTALSLDFSGNKEKALSVLTRGLKIAPDNEVYRFYIEKLAREVYLYKDEKRKNFSSWYIENGSLLENDFYYNKAMTYYLRGIDIDPLNWELRVKYASVLKKVGLNYSYLKELDFLVNDFPGEVVSSELSETLLIEDSLPKDELYDTWGDVSLKNSYKHKLFIATTQKNSRLNNNSSVVFSDVIGRFLSGNRRFDITGNVVFNDGFSSVFKQARDSDSNYFVILDYKEGHRSFFLSATLYLTTSGRVIKKFNFIKTGNNRIFNSIDSFLRDFENSLPLIGTVTGINNSSVLTDLGLLDNLNKEVTVKVVKKDQFNYISYGDLIEFNQEYLLGEINIGFISEAGFSGEFISNSSFNLLNKGDHVLVFDKSQEEEPVKETEEQFIDKELIDQLLRVN